MVFVPGCKDSGASAKSEARVPGGTKFWVSPPHVLTSNGLLTATHIVSTPAGASIWPRIHGDVSTRALSTGSLKLIVGAPSRGELPPLAEKNKLSKETRPRPAIPRFVYLMRTIAMRWAASLT